MAAVELGYPDDKTSFTTCFPMIWNGTAGPLLSIHPHDGQSCKDRENM